MERYNKPDAQDLERQKANINISGQNKYNANAIEVGESFKEGNVIGSPDYIPYESTRTILFQMEKCIANIKVEGVEGKHGTVCFCQIPFPDTKKGWSTKKVLITCNHIINRDLLYKPNSTISLLKNG